MAFKSSTAAQLEFARISRNNYEKFKDNEISFFHFIHKRHFHDYHGNGSTTPNQEQKRINIFRTAVGEDSLIAIIEPLIRKVVKEETESAITKLFPSSSSEAETSTAGYSLQLLFEGKLPNRIFTNNPLEAEGGKPLKVFLCHANSNNVVESGPLSSAKVDFVVVSGLFSRDPENWTKEFDSKILSERDGKRPLLAGPQSIILKNGVGVVSDLSITDNSSWIPNKKFILGAKISPKTSGEYRVKPASSCPFSVKDSRGEGYTKHYPPSLQDDVWRLEKIRKDGKYHQQLTSHGILTVEDFLLLNETNQLKLRSILARMSDKIWRKVLDHAKTCIMDNCSVSRYPNGWDKASVGDLNETIYGNGFDEQPTLELPLNYQHAGPSITQNLGLHPLGPGMLSQENLQICSPNTNNHARADGVLPPAMQPDYLADNCPFGPQGPMYYSPATLDQGNELLPSSSFAAEAGGHGIFTCFDHGFDILHGAD